MKKYLLLTLILLATILCTAGCGKKEDSAAPPADGAYSEADSKSPPDNTTPDSQTSPAQTAEDAGISATGNTDPNSSGVSSNGNILVVYFSATGNTKPIAECIAEITGADIFEIVPVDPYTDDDLNYHDSNSRANKEQNDNDVRPEIAEKIASIDDYNIIFIGHPIWWGEEPRIMDTFMESYDFSGKTLINFCTSGSSGIGTATAHLKALSEGADWLEGQRFSAGASEETIQNWVDSLNILEGKDISEMKNNKLGIQVDDTVLTATWENNSSAEALIERLQDGPLTVEMSDYANFEKVGSLGMDLPRNDTQITTEPGDVILYLGNQITIYYDTNSWNFTKLAKIDDTTQAELKKILGTGDVTVTLSLQ